MVTMVTNIRMLVTNSPGGMYVICLDSNPKKIDVLTLCNISLFYYGERLALVQENAVGVVHECT